MLPIDADGALGTATDIVEHPKPYAHMMATDPAGRWVLAVHYGVGSVFTYSGLVTAQALGRLAQGLEPDQCAG